MKTEVLRDILGHAGEPQGKAFDLRGLATFMLEGGGSVLVVDKVKAATLEKTHLVLQTLRGERFLCEPDRVLCIKLGKGDDEGTGFV
jgi:hypothetical protein